MYLEVATAKNVDIQAFTKQLANLGLVSSTLAHERTHDADAVEKAYACHLLCRRQQPPVELRQTAIAFDRWYQFFVAGRDAAPDAYFLAKDGEHYVAVCALVCEQDTPPLQRVSGFTGTLPLWQGQGLAKALK